MKIQYCPHICKKPLYQSDSNIDGFDTDGKKIKVDRYECEWENRVFVVPHGEDIKII
jgi:hypothetical protein